MTKHEARASVSPKVRSVTFHGGNSANDTPESLYIAIQINGDPVAALVDLGAQVTVLSPSFQHSMTDPPECIEDVKLRGASRDSQMTGHFTEKVKIQLGNLRFPWCVYVAPISDSVILGLDFLKAVGASIDLPSATFSIGDQVVPASYRQGQGQDSYKISRTVCVKRVTIPPQSSRQVLVRTTGLNKGSERGLMLCPKTFRSEVVCPYTLLDAGREDGVIELTNISDHFVKVKAGQMLGFSHPAQAMDAEVDTDEIPAMLRQVNRGGQDAQGDTVKVTPEEISTLSCQVPAHLQDLFCRSAGVLSHHQACELSKILTEFQAVFSVNDTDLGCFTAIKHSIDTQGARPVRQRMRRTPVGFQEEEEKHLTKMLDAGVIKPSSSAWAAVPVLVRKKDGSVRWCLDYWALNNVTVKDAFPLPKIEECLDSLAGSQFYSTLDMNSGYWQIELEEADQHKTAFITKYGLFEWTRMGFGLCNAPATFQRAVQLVLHGMQWKKVLSYLDDVVVFGNSFEQARDNLVEALEHFQSYKLKLKPKKCSLFQNEVMFLGRLVTPQGIRVNPESRNTIRDWPTPRCVRDIPSRA